MSGYLHEADGWLDALFRDHADGKLGYAELKTDIKSRLLESFKNGLKAREQSPVPRRGNPRGNAERRREAR
jgi:hypothetical protein